MLTDRRGASEVLGYVLVFTLILSSVTVVSVGVVDSLERRSDVESVDNAEAAFQVLANNIEDLYARSAPSRATEISVGNGAFYLGDNVTFQVQLVDTDTAPATYWPGGIGASGTWKSWRYRPLVYESQSGAKIAYEAGAIFRIPANAASPDSVSSADKRASVRKRDPPFVFRGPSGNEQVLIPVVHPNASTQRLLSSSTVLIRTGTAGTSLPEVEKHDTSSPYEEVKIRLTNTPRYLEWQAYLKEAGFDSCTTTPAQNRVTCTYVKNGGLTDEIEIVSIVGHEIPITLEE